MPSAARFDAAVVGLGAIGSHAALELARRGRTVVGLDRHRPPHSLGSTHGWTRIIREAYFEHPAYVPLVGRAYELWREFERVSGERLLTITGGLMLGPPDSAIVAGARRSAVEHRLPHQELSARDVGERFPAFRVPDEHVAIHEPRAGFLAVERAVAVALELAARAGAALRYDERVVGWESGPRGVRIETDAAVYEAGVAVLAAGPWLADLVPELGSLLTVTRQPVLWLEPARNAPLFAADRFPVFIWEWRRDRAFYGLADVGDGVKLALHHHGAVVSADTVDRELRPEDEEQVREPVRSFVPDADGRLRAAAVCLYTNTPDRHFVLDRLPGDERVVVASPCSGHGFKFAPALAEILADLAEGRDARAGPELFALSRFPTAQAPG